MRPARIAALLARHGREVTLQFAGEAGGGGFLDVVLRAHVMGFVPQPLAGDGGTMQQGERMVRIAQAALDGAGAPRAPRQGDRIVIDGKAVAITAAPDALAVSGGTAMLVLRVRGA